MLFTWDTENLCIVFRSWRVTGTMSLIWSLFAVMALTAGYELVRELSRRYEERAANGLNNASRKFYLSLLVYLSFGWIWLLRHRVSIPMVLLRSLLPCLLSIPLLLRNAADRQGLKQSCPPQSG